MSSLTQHRGFTLIELLVTLAVLVIVITVAVPSFRSLADNNRMTALANEMVAALNLARSEAVKRGAQVSVCSNAGGWVNGWTVQEGTACAGAVIRLWNAPTAAPTITTEPAGQTRVTFAALGNRDSTAECIHIESVGGSGDRVLLVGASGAISVVRRDACPE